MNIQKINFISPKFNFNTNIATNNFKTTPIQQDSFTKSNVSFGTTKTGMFDGKITTKEIDDLQFSTLMVTVDMEREEAEKLSKDAKILYKCVNDLKDDVYSAYKQNNRRFNNSIIQKTQDDRNQLTMLEYFSNGREVKRKSIFARGGILKSIVIPKTSNKKINTIYEFDKSVDGTEYLTCTVDAQAETNIGKKFAKKFHFVNGKLDHVIIDSIEANGSSSTKKEIGYNKKGELTQINCYKIVDKGITTIDKEIFFENNLPIKVFEGSKYFNDGKRYSCKCRFDI